MSLADVLPPPPKIKHKPNPEAGGQFATIVSDLYKRGRISPRQARAAQMFLADLTAYHGSTGMAGYQERVDTSTTGSKLSGWTQAHCNCQRILDRLWFHERETLHYLITQRERARGSLADLGRQLYGYADQDMAVAAATAKISAVLETIAEQYLGPMERVQ